MNPNMQAMIELMLKNALENQAAGTNNGKPLTYYDTGYLDGMITALKTIRKASSESEGN